MFFNRHRARIARSIVAVIAAGFIQMGLSAPIANAAPLAAPTITSSTVTASTMTVNLQTSGFAATSWRYIVNVRQVSGCTPPASNGVVQTTASLQSSITITGLTEGCYYTVKVAGFNGSIGAYAAVEKLVNGYVNGLKAYHKSENSGFTDFTRVPFTTGTCETGIFTDGYKDWGQLGPCSLIDNFTSYYVGYIKAPDTGTVSFNTANDDGVQLNIQGQNVLFSGSTYTSGSIEMKKDEIYRIELWHHEVGGAAAIYLYWQYNGGTSTLVPSANLATDPSVFFGTCPIGLDPRCPAGSALEIKRASDTNMDGQYWILINGTPTLVYSVMNSSQGGGGWMLAMRGKNASSTFQYNSPFWTNATLERETYPERFSASDSINTYRNTDAKYAPFTSTVGNQVMVLYPEVTDKAGGAFGTNGSANASGVNSVKYGFAWHETLTAGLTWSGYSGTASGGKPIGWGGDSYNYNPSGYTDVAGKTSPAATSFCQATAATLMTLFTNSSRCAFRQVKSKYSSTETPYSAIGNGVFFSQTDVRFFGINYGNSYNGSGQLMKARIGFGWNENYDGQEISNDGLGGIGLYSNQTGAANVAAGTYNYCCSADNHYDANRADRNFLTEGQAGLSTPGNSRQLGFELYVRNTVELPVAGNSVFQVTKGRTNSLVAARGYFTSGNSGTTTFKLSSIRDGFTIDPSTGVITVSEALPVGSYSTKVTVGDGNSASGSRDVTINVLTDSSETDSSLSFNGSNQFVSNVGTFSTPGDFTYEFWVKPNNNCSQQSGFNKPVSTTNVWISCWGGMWYFSYMKADNSTPNFELSQKVIANEWAHFAVVRTNSSTTGETYIYYNNKQINLLNSGWVSSVPITSFKGDFGNIRIGGSGTANEYFNGFVDEVKVWQRSRTLSDIWVGAHSQQSSYEDLLILMYDFNEASGNAISRGQRGDYQITLGTVQRTPIAAPIADGPYTVVSVPRTLINSIGGWRAPESITVITALVLGGGGGGGGGYQGGGGGAGGFLENTVVVDPTNVYAIRVGIGGVGASNPLSPSSGDTSTAFGLSAVGGGTGSSEFVNPNVQHSRESGGSGGGGTWGSFMTGGSGISGQGFAGGTATNLEGPACSPNQYAGAGGGGATSTGFAPSCTKGGNGGAPKLSVVTGTYKAGGGGGSLRSASAIAAAGLGGNGISGSAGDSSYVSGAAVGATGGATNAPVGSGGGGGAGNSSNGATGYGGAGGSGTVTFRYITAFKPVFTQPTNDTTTAGITDTITVSNNPISTLLRNFQWQRSTETGTTWSNITTGSGITSNTYTTPILDTGTSGIRYQYRVVVTDSDTAGLFIVDTSTAVFIVINPPIAISGTYTVQKYGQTHTDTFTAVTGTGTGNKTFTFPATNRNGLTWNGATANQATLTVARTIGPGTYQETITATDSRGAQTSLIVSVVITKADTVTVTTLAVVDTFTGSALTFNPRFTVSGLQNSDTVTPMTWSYQGADNAGTSYGISTSRPMNAGNYTISGEHPIALNDSYTAVRVDTATLTINRATRSISIGALTSPIKYGDTRTAIATLTAGSGDGTISYLTSTSDSCTVSSSTIRAVRSAGTCSFTAIIARGNNFESATSTAVTTTLTKADTVTVQVRNPVTLTYSASPAASVPVLNIVGLVHTDTATATTLYSHPASVVGAPESYPALTDSSLIPTHVETYTVSSSALTFTSGVLANYQNVVYETSTLIINQANQQPLRIAMYGAFVGSSYTITTDGGSGGGLVTETITAGSTASGCSINSRILTMTSTIQSYCNILVTKAASRNFRLETTTAQINFYLYIFTAPTPVGGGPGIGITGLNSVTTDAEQAPTFASLNTTAGAIGSPLRIYGTGFFYTDQAKVEIKFSRSVIATTFTLVSDSEILVTVPLGATTSRISITTPRGLAATSTFTVVP